MKIAISGKSGCGNSTVSRLVSKNLGLEYINYTFRNMADDIGMTFAELQAAAQESNKYDKLLDNKQKELARKGNCVVGSRLAIWLIDDADLKVFLDASVEVRAGRIHQREGGSLDNVIKETIMRDDRDSARYKDIYNIDNNNFSFVDIIIDTAKYSAEEVAELIVAKAKEKGKA